MKILVINQSPISYFKDILFELGKKHEVTLFCGERDESLPNFIKYVFSKNYKRNSFFTRIKSWLIFSANLSIYLLFNSHKYKKILIVSNPPFAIWLTLICPGKTSILLFDIYPNILEQLDIRNKLFLILLRFVVYLWKFLNALSYLFADKIFTISESMRKEIIDSNHKFILNESKLRVIYPWGNVSQFNEQKRKNIIKKNLLKDNRILIIYSGNIGLTHPLEYLVESSDYIKNLAKVIIIGDGAKKERLKNIQIKLKFNNTTFLEPVDYDEFPFFINNADLCVVCIDGPAAKYSLPSKFFTALSYSKPVLVIAPEDSELAQIVNKYNCGFVLSQDEEFKRNLYEILKNLQKKPNLLKILSLNAAKTSEKFNKKNSMKFVECFINPVM